ncbi:PREDICTED: N-acetyltransferase 9-like protein isoform X4 [Dinoponera quadriceps]|uniref:N-acetyltransferase 9-like protein isoform X4 n=1 Tax=Dinoponera quadriceps TaxID=609295 RepID=A0A6P3XGW7_DINQU|nr:PREDICTED: N-acetyltransferase 9-like protein isoform X4 [Dinoponera quadriceps]
MRKNANTRITGTNVILVPYQKKHVAKYHEWMKCPMLRYLTGSEPLTLEEEFEMQIHWLEDEDKCTFIILDKHVFDSTESEAEAMIGDTNLFFNDPQEPHIAEVEIMIADEASRGKKRGVERLGVSGFRAKIKLDNALSIKMFEKLGFQEVDRSQVFQEITLEKRVSLDWTNRFLSLQLQSIAPDSNQSVVRVISNH